MAREVPIEAQEQPALIGYRWRWAEFADEASGIAERRYDEPVNER